MSTTPIPSLTLNDGHTIPRSASAATRFPEQTQAAAAIALEAGYRHIDMAAAYRNETETGTRSHNTNSPGPWILDRALIERNQNPANPCGLL